MTLKTGSVHTINNHWWEDDFSKRKTLIVLRPEKIFPKCYDSPGLTIQGGTSKLPYPIWGRNWWWRNDVYSRKTKKVLLHPAFTLLIKLKPTKFLGSSISHPPACKPHQLPVLINHFLSTTLLLLNSPRCWHKGLWYRRSLETSWNDSSQFQVDLIYALSGLPAAKVTHSQWG